jgi:adenylate cyclase
VREIGGRLNVEYVVEGSVRRAGHRIRIAAQVVNVRDGYCAWYERFDRTIEDIFAVQDEIAEQIARR